jgi:CSLREA domain-containing protein
LITNRYLLIKPLATASGFDRRESMNMIAKAAVTILIALCFTAAVSAATFVVNTTADTQDANAGDGVCADASSNCSFRAAISEANALAGNDIITLPAGTYTQSLVATPDEQLNAGGDWNIRSNVTVNGAGAANTILQAAATPGTATERVLRVHFLGTIVTINGVTIRHGNKVGTSAIEDVGGGVYNGGAFLHIDSSVITLNSSSRGGGVFAYGTFNLSFSTVTANSCVSSSAECYGGGISGDQIASLNMTIANSTVSSNTAAANGANGVAHGAGIALTTTFFAIVQDTTISGNQGSGTGNGGSDGSGLYLNNQTGSSTLNITTTTSITGNGGTGTNVKGSGIAVFNNGTLNGTWNRLTLDGNTAGSRGGGLLVENTGGTLNLNVNNSTISNNSGGTAGGGVMISSDAATPAASANINFLNTTISGNSASGPIPIGMSTLGGGVRAEQIQPAVGTLVVNFNYCTVANNTSDVGGGIIFTGGIGNLKNTIVAANTAGFGPDIFSVINSQDYNHISNVSNAAIAGVTAHNETGNAMLGPLQINGSGLPTQLPLPGSPVIDKIPTGTNDCGSSVNADERFITRPQAGMCDKGAAEVQFPLGPFNLAGNVSTSDGRPIRNVVITISGGGLPNPIKIYTGTFGNYFISLPGASYTVAVKSRRFTIAGNLQTVTLNVNNTNVNFVADPDVGARKAQAVMPAPVDIKTSIKPAGRR